MAFPTNPTNGQQATVNGVVYTYNSTLTVWAVGTEPGGNVSGNILNITSTATFGSTISATGNITGGNLITGGTTNTTGTITGGNLETGGTVSATGNVAGGNVTTGGTISSTGTITGGNVTTGGNVSATGTITSSGTATGGNLVTGGTLSVTGLTTLGANLTITGHNLPSANATYDLGSTSSRWRTVYTTDLELNNGIGDYTVVEGTDDLFLYNNRSGKVFKFALIEVDPAIAPPKAKR